jgi:DNA-binding response OmpR family regulator
VSVDVSIVLVDNEPKFLVAYERLLRGLGCTTFCAQRLSDAIPYVLSPHVALVVVEPRLADGDGLELIRMARRTRPQGSGIAITAFPSQVGARQAGEAGAAGYLAKPFSGRVFVGLAERLVGTWRTACCGSPVGERPSPGEASLT